MILPKSIVIQPDLLHGAAHFCDTRIPVYIVLLLLAEGYTRGSILSAYPGLTAEDIRHALVVCARMMGAPEEATHA